MAINIRKQERVEHPRLRGVQDHPIPMESHGLGDQRIETIISQSKHAFQRVKDEETKRSLNAVLETLEILRKNTKQFDAVRRNVETLWNRRESIERVESSEGVAPVQAQSSSGGTSPPSPTSLLDKDFFAYDEAGGTAFNSTEVELPLDTEILKDSGYTHVLGSEEIVLVAGGFYNIDADASFALTSSDSVEFKLQVDSGAGFVDIEGSKSYTGV